MPDSSGHLPLGWTCAPLRLQYEQTECASYMQKTKPRSWVLPPRRTWMAIRRIALSRPTVRIANHEAPVGYDAHRRQKREARNEDRDAEGVYLHEEEDYFKLEATIFSRLWTA